MNQPGTYTFEEIISQPAALREALAVIDTQATSLRNFFRDADCSSLLFIGCGSPYYLAHSASVACQSLLGMPARALPASEVWLNAPLHIGIPQRTLLVALSRSGETTETLRAVDAFRKHQQGAVLTISCYGDRSLATQGDYNLVLASGQEQSIAQTRAFTTLQIATLALATIWSEQNELFAVLTEVPEMARRVIEQSRGVAQKLAANIELDRSFFLGSGTCYGLACELSLKMKEMSLTTSEPFHALEFRHGPQSMAGLSTLVVGLVSEANQRHEQAVFAEMAARGATIVTLGENGTDIRFGSGIAELLRGPLYLPFGQLLAYEYAIVRGLDPDRPHNLQAVVTLAEDA